MMDEYFKSPGQSFEDRINWVKAFFLLIIFLIGLRAVYLQVIEHDKLDKMAQDKARKIKTVSIQRGKIFDAEGELLAVSLPVYSVFAYPEQFQSTEKTHKILSVVLENNFNERQLKKRVGFTWVNRYVSDEQHRVLKRLNLPGIYFVREFMRIYPQKKTASQLLGLVGLDSIGLDGLEYRYDKYLMGNFHVDSEDEQIRRYYSQGNDIQLTISQKIQFFTERSLRNSVLASRSKSGIVIVMETKTGAILAMAGYPNFDPNQYEKFPKSLYVNKAVNTAYEPGSTFKVISLSIARQLNVIQSNAKIFCENGAYDVQGKTITDVKPHGTLSLNDTIKYSSNICMLKIGNMIPADKYHEWILKFGFGKKTKIDLPGESPGVVHDYRSWSELDQAVLSFGHSIQATPIQLISAINVIANRGVYVSPYVVNSITNPVGKQTYPPRRIKMRIIDEDIAKEIAGYMVSVIEKGGTGATAAIDTITVAGKTGTTKKFDLIKKEYSSENHIRSFVGFLPAEDPSLTILAILNEPREKYKNTRTATPMFKEIAVNAYRFFTKKQSSRFVETKEKYDAGKLFGKADKVENIRRLSGKSLREILYYASVNKKQLIVSGKGTVKKINGVNSKKLRVFLD